MTTLNSSNLSHPALCARIKHTVTLAVIASHISTAGVGQKVVTNASGKPLMRIVAHRGGDWRAQATDHEDITHAVKAALRAYHASA